MQLTDIGRIDNKLTGTINVAGDPNAVVNIARAVNDGTINVGLMQLTDANDIVKSGVNSAVNIGNGFVDVAKNTANTVVDGANNVVDGVKDTANNVVNGANNVVNAVANDVVNVGNSISDFFGFMQLTDIGRIDN